MSQNYQQTHTGKDRPCVNPSCNEIIKKGENCVQDLKNDVWFHSYCFDSRISMVIEYGGDPKDVDFDKFWLELDRLKQAQMMKRKLDAIIIP